MRHSAKSSATRTRSGFCDWVLRRRRKGECNKPYWVCGQPRRRTLASTRTAGFAVRAVKRITFAATADPGLPGSISAPAASPGLDAGRCPAPAPSLTVGTPAVREVYVPPSDFILCSCDLCKDQPDVVCQISPSGYSIRCVDYSRLNCGGGGPVD